MRLPGCAWRDVIKGRSFWGPANGLGLAESEIIQSFRVPLAVVVWGDVTDRNQESSRNGLFICHDNFKFVMTAPSNEARARFAHPLTENERPLVRWVQTSLFYCCYSINVLWLRCWRHRAEQKWGDECMLARTVCFQLCSQVSRTRITPANCSAAAVRWWWRSNLSVKSTPHS